MAYQYPNSIRKVTSRDLRECHFFLRYLSSIMRCNLIYPNNAEACVIQINQAIKTLSTSNSNEYMDELLLNMKTAKEQCLLPESKYQWLDMKNERLIFIAWIYLRISIEIKFDRTVYRLKKQLLKVDFKSKNIEPDNLYDEISEYPTPTSTSERHAAIIDFIDKWNVSIQHKVRFIEFLKIFCCNKLTESKKFAWLSAKNSEQAQWAWNYLKSAEMPYDILKPISPAEQINACIVIFDVWDEHPAVKELFLLKFKKAWSQKKHRDGLVDQKAYNITMSNDVQGMLETLSTHYDDKINKTLEKIIRREYARITQR